MSVLTRLCHLQICTALESSWSSSTHVRYMLQLTCASCDPFFLKLGSFLGVYLDISLVCERDCRRFTGFTIQNNEETDSNWNTGINGWRSERNNNLTRDLGIMVWSRSACGRFQLNLVETTHEWCGRTRISAQVGVHKNAPSFVSLLFFYMKQEEKMCWNSRGFKRIRLEFSAIKTNGYVPND